MPKKKTSGDSGNRTDQSSSEALLRFTLHLERIAELAVLSDPSDPGLISLLAEAATDGATLAEETRLAGAIEGMKRLMTVLSEVSGSTSPENAESKLQEVRSIVTALQQTAAAGADSPAPSVVSVSKPEERADVDATLSAWRAAGDAAEGVSKQLQTYKASDDPADLDQMHRCLEALAESLEAHRADDLTALCRAALAQLVSPTEPALKKAAEAIELLIDECSERAEERVSHSADGFTEFDDDMNAAAMDALDGPDYEALLDGSTERLLEPIPITDLDMARDFITEATEHFDAADESLVRLESDPSDYDAICAVFRAFHTLKGVSSFLDLDPLSLLAHEAETLLDLVRKGTCPFTGDLAQITFSALDLLKAHVPVVEKSVTEGVPFQPRSEIPELISRLRKVIEQNGGKPPQTGQPAEKATTSDDGSDSDVQIFRPRRRKAATAATPEGNGKPNAPVSSHIKSTMKVDADKIDFLLDTIGELVIAQSIVSRAPELQGVNSPRFEKELALLTKITRTLQDAGMAMRLVPIAATFRKMSRVIRDLAHKAGKVVDFEMHGLETEIDKGMVEKLQDPLVHMIRNAVDHGIESAEDRLRSGKLKSGTIHLRASHKGGNIHIELEDDGRGLDRETIITKAIDRGLITTAEGMTEQEVFSLIFRPGFSTTEQVTEISGRGVGMDVVKRNVDALRGNIVVSSTPGKGTVFTLVLPLTMAIIDGMVARVGNEAFILPVLSIVESLRPHNGVVSSVAGRGEVVRFREHLLPMVRLAEIFEVKNATNDPHNGIVLVVEDAGRQIAILVDELLGQQQTVIKGLGDGIGQIDGISGASIMSDGSPCLIVDIAGVAKIAFSRASAPRAKLDPASGTPLFQSSQP